MGKVISLRERVPVLVTKNRLAARRHQERERAMIHAQMMMVGAIVTSGLMMIGLALLSAVN